jgi:hypothetical protein
MCSTRWQGRLSTLTAVIIMCDVIIMWAVQTNAAALESFLLVHTGSPQVQGSAM